MLRLDAAMTHPGKRPGGNAGIESGKSPTTDRMKVVREIHRDASRLRQAAAAQDLHFLAYLLDMAVSEADRAWCATESDNSE